MNKRTYHKIVKRIINYPITNPPYVLTPLEKRVNRRFEAHCCRIAERYIGLLDAEDDYYGEFLVHYGAKSL